MKKKINDEWAMHLHHTGIMSDKTLCEHFDLNFASEAKRKFYEKKLKENLSIEELETIITELEKI